MGLQIASYISVVCLLLLKFSNAETIRCPPNEQFTECDTACPLTCQNQNRESVICTAQCLSRCSCIKGYIRSGPGGRCVPDSCEGIPICKENEIFSTCANRCPEICNQTEPVFCPLYCGIGCDCKEGYIRESGGGRCVPEHICPANFNCEKNQVFNACGTACPGTCTEPVKRCDKRCTKGCFCRNGYLWSEKERKCVKKECCN